MNNTIFLLLFISILILIGKYMIELKSDKILFIVLALFGITCLGYILKGIFHAPIFISIGIMSGMIISPIVFSVYLLRQKGNQKERLIRILMLFPTLTLFIIYLFKGLHMPVYGILYFLMIISVLIGGYIVIKKPRLKEILPFQVILIFMIIDIVALLMK